jgi:catalase (peroxidase I)
MIVTTTDLALVLGGAAGLITAVVTGGISVASYFRQGRMDER